MCHDMTPHDTPIWFSQNCWLCGCHSSVDCQHGRHLQTAVDIALYLLLQVKRQEAYALKLAHLAIMSLQRARQIQPSEHCQILEQECGILKKTHTLVPSGANAARFQECLTEFTPCINYS